MTRRYERNPLTDEHGDHADHEFVDRSRVEKGSNDPAAPHQPDVLTRALAQSLHERGDITVHELYARRNIGTWRLAREDDRRVLGVELRTEAQTRLVGLAAEDLGVDRLHELVHAVEPGRRRPRCQPVEVIVRSCDETVRTGRDVHDDASALRHKGTLLRSDISWSVRWSWNYGGHLSNEASDALLVRLFPLRLVIGQGLAHA